MAQRRAPQCPRFLICDPTKSHPPAELSAGTTAAIALAIPADHSTGENFEISSRLLAPIFAQPSRSASRRYRTEANPETSPGAINAPFQNSFTKSAAHPATRLTITGSPQAIASFTTNPQGSL